MADSVRNSLAERDVEQAITALKKGSYLLKYGRRGKPKFCPFHLSSDESALVWYSGKEEKQIELNQVLRIIPGQLTATFKRYPRPEKEYQSFSLICHDRSLDLICKDKDEAEVWFVGLKALITRGRVYKERNNIKSETASSPESPSTRARRISPFATVFDPVIQSPPENTAQQRLGKVFGDIVSLTAPTSNNQTDLVSNPLSPLSPGNVENSNSRSSIGEPIRVSLSSAVSSSSQGSYREDFDALGDVFIWGEGTRDGVPGGTRKSSSSTTEDALLPQALESKVVLDVHNIACGRSHAVLVTKQGEIFSWGDGLGGKLGHGLEVDAPQPRLINALRGMSVEFLACGEFHTCAVTLSGDLYTWGGGTQKADMLGHGSEASYWNPKRVTGFLEGMHVSYVSCGPWHTAVVTSSGQLFTFGDGSFGALGHGDRNSSSIPREVESLSGLRTTRVACGIWHTAAVVEVITEASDSEPSSSCGQLFTWGDGNKGQLGHGDGIDTKLLPESVIALSDENICQVACGHSLTVALTTKGHVYTMGSTVYGQLGNPTADGKVPARLEGEIVENPVEEIACGSYHIAVLTSKSEVYTWGKGSNGQLGHGTVEHKKKPAFVEFLKDKQVKAVTCGSNSTAVICVHKWVTGTDHSVCAGCRNPFNFRRKRHNCYNCGLVFCKVCSSRKSLKAALAPDMNKPYRVCYGCFTKLKKSMESVPSMPTPTARSGNKQKSTDVTEREILVSKLLSQHSRISSVDSIIHGEGRQLRRGSRSEVNDRSLFPAVNGNLQPVGLPSPKGSTSPVRLPKNLLVSIPGSRVSSRTTSPVSVKSSPRRSYEVTAEESKQTKDSLSQEMASLRAQVEQLTSKTHHLEEELEKTRKQLKEVTAMAADEAEESRSAKDVIKSLTAQLKEMAERLPWKDGASSNSKPTVNETSNAQTQTFSQSHKRSMVPRDNEPKSNVGNRTLANGSKTQNEKAEGVVQDEPGVYLTLLPLPSGGNELKRVRFSRKHFTEEQAEKWWAENGGKVCERHNIRIT